MCPREDQRVNSFCCHFLYVVSDVGTESNRDLKRLLRQMGYSEAAMSEILKWYENDTLSKDTVACSRRIRS